MRHSWSYRLQRFSYSVSVGRHCEEKLIKQQVLSHCLGGKFVHLNFISFSPTLKVDRFIKASLHGSVETEYSSTLQRSADGTGDVICGQPRDNIKTED